MRVSQVREVGWRIAAPNVRGERASLRGPWLAVAAIVVASCAIRIALARATVAPWIFVDELIYSELAKSFAATGSFAVRGVPSDGYGFVYPTLIAPAWAAFRRVPDAFFAAKAIGCVVMSATAVPSYLLARRVVGAGRAVLVAVLSVAVPSMAYSATLMTETVFYPLFVLVAFALVVTLERPTVARQLCLAGLCGLAFLTRAQAVAVVGAVLTAPLVLAAIGGGGFARTLRRFAPTYAVIGGGCAVAVVVAAVRSGSPFAVLGAYRSVSHGQYRLADVARFVGYHVADLDLYLGVVPFAALVALWLAPRTAPAFAAASASLVAWIVVEVAAFASLPSVRQLQERDLFFVAPLAFTALFALRVDAPRIAVAAAVAALAPALMSVHGLLADTLAGAPWWWLQDHGVSAPAIRALAVLLAIPAAALLLVLPRRAGAVSLLLLAYFAGTTVIALYGRHGIERASSAALQAGIGARHADWIDRAVGRDADAPFVWSGRSSPYVVWENEFFNRSVGTVYSTGPALPGALPLVHADDRRLAAVETRYVVTDGAVDVAGTVVARDPVTGVRVLRVDGPVVLLTHVTGLYDAPGNTWSGGRVTYTRRRCDGGTLSVLLQTDAGLYRSAQTVTARAAGVVRRVRIDPAGQATLTVPLRPGAARTCTVVFTTARTVVPAQVDPSSSDHRPLGAHFLRFDFRS